jgi:hypothetical protein
MIAEYEGAWVPERLAGSLLESYQRLAGSSIRLLEADLRGLGRLRRFIADQRFKNAVADFALASIHATHECHEWNTREMYADNPARNMLAGLGINDAIYHTNEHNEG